MRSAGRGLDIAGLNVKYREMLFRNDTSKYVQKQMKTSGVKTLIPKNICLPKAQRTLSVATT